MYYELAHLYDWSGSLDFAEKIREKDLALLRQSNIQPPARILDLACGTGSLALSLAQMGYHVLGIDLSPAMLAQAHRKQQEVDPDHTLPLQWMQADMRYFVADWPPDEHFDAVLCHYDSLNHLSNETELRASFLQVAQVLKPGGLFSFDLNTLENYRTFWNGGDSDEGENYRLKTQTHFDEATGKAAVTFTVDEYNEDGELLSRSEQVHEQYFNETAVEKYLMAAEFYDIHSKPFNPVDEIPADFPLKTFWQCKRR